MMVTMTKEKKKWERKSKRRNGINQNDTIKFSSKQQALKSVYFYLFISFFSIYSFIFLVNYSAGISNLNLNAPNLSKNRKKKSRSKNCTYISCKKNFNYFNFQNQKWFSLPSSSFYSFFFLSSVFSAFHSNYSSISFLLFSFFFFSSTSSKRFNGNCQAMNTKER